LEEIQKLHGLPDLTLDGGNLLFKQERLAPGLLMQAKITAEGIVESYNLMGYDAVAVGRNDLAAGLGFLQDQAAASKFTWLSANLVSKSNGEPLFSPSLIRKVGDISVGIIGLTDIKEAQRFQEENAVLLPWQSVLPKLVADLTPKCDLLILLSNNEPKQNEEIATSFTDIHIIIQSNPSARNSVPQLKNNSLMAKTGKQGKYLGWMLVNWQKSKTWGHTGAVKELALKKQELDGIIGRIGRLERREKKEDLEANASYQKLVVTREQLLSEIIFLENELYDLKESGQIPSTFENNFITLDINLPDQPEVEKIVNLTKKRVNQVGRSQAKVAGRTVSGSLLPLEKLIFTGWQACAECHKDQTEFWQKTDHAEAYQSLVEQDQQFNLDCLPCHVTAEYKDIKISGDDTVFLSLPAPLLQVGCEVCHGPGKDHVASQKPTAIYRRPDITICLRCHTTERDEMFNYSNDIEKIACPASLPMEE
jgi:hypothetical protein